MLDEEEQPNPALIGRISCDQITPYPPGIPALVPGQEISSEVLVFLLQMMRSHKRTEMHGVIMDGYVPCLRVLSAPEAKRLTRLARR